MYVYGALDFQNRETSETRSIPKINESNHHVQYWGFGTDADDDD
jgi:hypothetical protein